MLFDLPEDAEQLVDLSVTLKERLLQKHLGKDASDGPDVNGSGITRASQQDLGRTIPQRDDLEGKQIC
jgi:hypothetical protein